MTLQINSLSLTAGSFHLKSITLEIQNGEYFVLMGPTGSGKSLFLKSICGLQSIETGSIIIAGKDVTNLPPRERNLGYVPQRSNLFPNMNVARNIQFPLDMRGIKGAEADKKVSEIAEMLKITHLLDRATYHLSGGERQKVALARALAAKPAILILDEPVSAVDEPTRREICKDLATIQKELKMTTIHVCHSEEEAKSVADKAGILYHGVLKKVGTVDEISKLYYNKSMSEKV
jgi:ABC-type sugar transport system ATPase subunit